MARELRNVMITHVSYVDKGANKKQFFLLKSDEGKPTFEKQVKLFINKEEEEKKLVYGVVYEPNVEDSQGDFMTEEEIEKSAHNFLTDARNIDKQHNFESGYGEVVESYIAPVDFEVGEHTIKKGSWVLVTRASDEIWEEIKKGNITGYSMAGTAEVIEKQNDSQIEKPNIESSKSSKGEDDEMKGFFNMIKNFFMKGELAERHAKTKVNREFWYTFDLFQEILYEEFEYSDEPDIDRVRDAFEDMVAIMQDALHSDDIIKAIGKPSRKEDENMKKEDIEKLLDEKLSEIESRLNQIEKDEGIAKEDQTDQANAEVLGQISKLIDEKLAPITERLEVVEKVRGVSKQVDIDDIEGIEKSDQPSYLRYFV